MAGAKKNRSKTSSPVDDSLEEGAERLVSSGAAST